MLYSQHNHIDFQFFGPFLTVQIHRYDIVLGLVLIFRCQAPLTMIRNLQYKCNLALSSWWSFHSWLIKIYFYFDITNERSVSIVTVMEAAVQRLSSKSQAWNSWVIILIKIESLIVRFFNNKSNFWSAEHMEYFKHLSVNMSCDTLLCSVMKTQSA